MAFVIEQEFAETEHSYDREGDVLYLSFGPPVPAVSLVVEDWLVLRVSPSFPPKFVGMTLVGFKKLFSKVRPDLIEELPARVEHLKAARLVVDYSDERDTCTFRFEAEEPAYYERFGQNIYLERAVVDSHITGLKITDYTARGQAAIEEVLTAMLDSLFSVTDPNSPVDALTRAFLEHFNLRHLLTLAA
jgi:hypothetical protein